MAEREQAEWLVRIYAPACLRRAGMVAHAEVLASLPDDLSSAAAQAAVWSRTEGAWTRTEEGCSQEARVAARCAVEHALGVVDYHTPAPGEWTALARLEKLAVEAAYQ